jgi:endo-1,4-beta-xylanase
MHGMTRRGLLGAVGAAAAGSWAGAIAAPGPSGIATPSGIAVPARATLRSIAEARGLNVGNVFSDSYQFTRQLADIARRETNAGFLEFYWFELFPEPGQVDFTLQERYYAQAAAAKQKVFAHTIVYGAQVNPGWLVDGVNNGSIDRSQAISILQSGIQTIMERFGSRIGTWIVVNEAGDEGDLWMRAIGPEYVDIAFAEARRMAPNAKLIYNDYSNHTSLGYDEQWRSQGGENTERTRAIVSRLRRRGHLDGVGVQMHLRGDVVPSREELLTTLRSYRVPVYVTEFDIDIRFLRGSREMRWARQAEIYRLVTDACVDAGVRNFFFWGLVDRFSWKQYCVPDDFCSVFAQPTLFSSQYVAKPAYHAFSAAMSRVPVGPPISRNP